MRSPRYLFSLQGQVSRAEYAEVGVILMIFKYVVESIVITYFSGMFYSPLDFFNPLLSTRSQFASHAPDWLGFAWVLWTLPFLWIAISMSIRRAMDVGANPWVAMLMLVPIVNFLLMIYLAWVPSGHAERIYVPQASYRRTNQPGSLVAGVDVSDDTHVKDGLGLNAALVGITVGFVYMFASVTLGIYFFHSYGAAMFYGTPFISGAATAYTYNRWSPRSLSSTIWLSVLTGMLFACAFLLIGLEGLICIAMAAPIILPLGILGALVGRAIAIQTSADSTSKDRGLISCLLLLPAFTGAEAYFNQQHEFEVLSVVEIAASPEKVWNCVVSFPPITSEPDWFFRWGISTPLGARIKGEGVGAMRYCDFTTGSFVEPVTVWDPPKVLAFDVTDQPEPMTELSPYRHVHPPHLDGSFRSTHGEFRLIPLEGGGTRLEGRTWYKLDIYPHAYWTIWTDWLIHKIHGRVLEHIKELAEDENQL